MVSVSHEAVLAEIAERREAVAEALASVRAEGLEPSPEALEMFAAVIAGELGIDEVEERLLARYAR